MIGAKPRAVEELIDFYLHRRLAVPVVKLGAKLGLSPNQVTFLALVWGCLSALTFYEGSYFWGAILLLLAIVFDCADGMLARAIGQAGPVGRILDGLLDLIWVSLIWVGIYRSGHLSLEARPLLHFMEAAAISMILHCWTYDAVKTSYLGLCEPDFSDQNLDWREARRRMKVSFGSRRFLEGVIYLLMSVHHAVFVRGGHRTVVLPPLQQLRAREQFLLPMRLWSFLGEGTHLGMMVLAGLLTPWQPDAMLAVFGIILIPLNLLWGIAGILWFLRKKEILASPET